MPAKSTEAECTSIAFSMHGRGGEKDRPDEKAACNKGRFPNKQASRGLTKGPLRSKLDTARREPELMRTWRSDSHAPGCMYGMH
eukprot:1157916-Pelagomonas_calceolata.AAC.5